jgi:hypothetical protein
MSPLEQTISSLRVHYSHQRVLRLELVLISNPTRLHSSPLVVTHLQFIKIDLARISSYIYYIRPNR